jgi:recombinational DNA repair ATPase RecF
VHQINNISIAGFKRLQDVDLEMRPLMVIIGGNGVGKTSMLDAVKLVPRSFLWKVVDLGSLRHEHLKHLQISLGMALPWQIAEHGLYTSANQRPSRRQCVRAGTEGTAND